MLQNFSECLILAFWPALVLLAIQFYQWLATEGRNIIRNLHRLFKRLIYSHY